MASVHVNSTGLSPTATPASPYATWQTAAATISAASGVAGVGDDVYIHPSHSETVASNITWAGTQASPVKIVCGTPGASTGITAEQSTAALTVAAAGSAISWNGSYAVRGISFRLTGSTGTAVWNFGGTTGAGVQEFTNCEFLNSSSSISPVFNLGGSTVSSVDENLTVLNNCIFRFALSNHFIRLLNRVVMNGISFVSGGATPAVIFSVGYAAQDTSTVVEASGIDFTNLGTAVPIMGSGGRTGSARFRNCKMPSGWAGNFLSSTAVTGFKAELLNYGDGDTNYKFWIEDRHGRAKDETTIKRTTNPASDGTTSYSMHILTLTNCAYPSTVYRSPPIIKRHAASSGTPRKIAVQIAHDGSSALTDKEVWVEVEYLGTVNSPLANFTSDRANYLSSAAAQPASGIAWDGATGTGLNGTSTWHRLQLETPSITIQEEGYLIATVCVARPDFHIYIDPQINVTVA